MMYLARSQTADLPRRKIYIDHLGQLLRERVIQPETQVAHKLFPNHHERHLHQRSKSSQLLRLRNKQQNITSQIKPHTSHQSVKLLLSAAKQHIIRPIFQEIRPKSTILREVRPSFEGALFALQAKSGPFQQYSSVQLSRPKEEEERVFLRKGSNLQRQIATSLIRSSAQGIANRQYQYNKGQIMKMIHIFKGKQDDDRQSSPKKKVLVSYASAEAKRMAGQSMKEIRGWEGPVQMEVEQAKE